MTDPDDFAALRAALEAGPTPGPWESTAYEQDRRYGKQELIDCEYIAAANPEVIARLLAELDARYDQEAMDEAIGLERESYGQLMAENVKLRADLDALRADAERYRFIRSQVGHEDTDTEIDAAMKDKP